jgi:hypothetical protein
MNNETHNNRIQNANPSITRLETILKMLVRQATGQLDLPEDSFNGRVEQHAARLVDEGVLVLVGDLHPSHRGQRNLHVQQWVNAYAELYYLLNFGLFDTTDEPTAYVADNKYPLIVVFKAQTLVVMRVLADLIIPYIALRQADGKASRAELRGMIEMMLEELEASTLPMEKYSHIRDRGIILLDTLLKSEIRQVALTNFSRQFLIDTGTKQTTMQDAPRPDSLPELPMQKPNTMPLSPKASPGNILQMPLPNANADIDVPVPRLSMLDRLNRKNNNQ